MTHAPRRLRYQVAASLDGFIAGPGGEHDWIPMDPDIDFAALFAQFDTLLMGRRTWDGLTAGGQAGAGGAFGMTTIVCSTTLEPDRATGVRVFGGDVAAQVRALKAAPGRDIWLFGGGQLFRSLAAAGVVDTVEVALVPILLGGGLPLFPAPADRLSLRLTRHQVYPKSGITLLEYTL